MSDDEGVYPMVAMAEGHAARCYHSLRSWRDMPKCCTVFQCRQCLALVEVRPEFLDFRTSTELYYYVMGKMDGPANEWLEFAIGRRK